MRCFNRRKYTRVSQTSREPKLWTQKKLSKKTSISAQKNKPVTNQCKSAFRMLSQILEKMRDEKEHHDKLVTYSNHDRHDIVHKSRVCGKHLRILHFAGTVERNHFCLWRQRSKKLHGTKKAKQLENRSKTVSTSERSPAIPQLRLLRCTERSKL